MEITHNILSPFAGNPASENRAAFWDFLNLSVNCGMKG